MVHRQYLLLPVILLVLAGCSSNPEYGIEPSPLVQELEGEDHGSEMEQQITRENRRALEEEQEPIFTMDDSGTPE